MANEGNKNLEKQGDLQEDNQKEIRKTQGNPVAGQGTGQGKKPDQGQEKTGQQKPKQDQKQSDGGRC